MEAIQLNGSKRLKNTIDKAIGKSKATSKASKASKHLKAIEVWGTRYVIVACVLSSGLNAWANVDMIQSDSVFAQVASGSLGAVVPLLAWMLSKIAGHAYRAGRKRTAMFVGTAGLALLILSVWHCAHAIALLTGGGIVLSGLLAIGIDYGLVASEVSAVMSTE